MTDDQFIAPEDIWHYRDQVIARVHIRHYRDLLFSDIEPEVR